MKVGTGFWLTTAMILTLIVGVTLNVIHVTKQPKATKLPAAVLPYQVTVFQAVPATVPYERDGKMHFFCHKSAGYLVMIYEDKIAIDREGCK